MRRRIAVLSKAKGQRRADIATAKEEEDFVEAAQEERRRATEQAKRPLSADEEFLYVEDRSDTPNRHPIERVSLGPSAARFGAVRSSRVAAVIWATHGTKPR